MRDRANALRCRSAGCSLARGIAVMICLMLVPGCEWGSGGEPEAARSRAPAPAPSRPVDIGKIIPCDVFTGEEKRQFSIDRSVPGSGESSRWCNFYTNQTTMLVFLTLWKHSAEIIVEAREKRRSELEEGISPRIEASVRTSVNGRKTYQYHAIHRGLGKFGCGVFFPIDRESSAEVEIRVGGTCDRLAPADKGRWERILTTIEGRLPPFTP